MTIEEVIQLREKEDKVEFKEAANSFSFEGGDRTDYRKRRKCVLGYVVALANEKGGKLIFGVREGQPMNTVVGSAFMKGKEGELEQRIYDRLKIRVTAEEVFDKDGKRILILHIPSRPIGKVLTFEDTPLMRIGDRLERMSDEEYLSVINEQEPDFSAEICQGLSFSELSEDAINHMKRAYAKKQQNPVFLTLSSQQVLNDLGLIVGSELTYAALILLGKSTAIQKYLPQSAVNLEYRSKRGQITFDKREFFKGGYFAEVDALWNSIDSRNGAFPVQEGAYIFDIPYFNQEVIREAINNAVAHRDYRLNGEIVIRQYPNHLEIVNPGGFPKGVTIENLLTVSSTPRNRKLADVLSKTGMVERSGQGVDKIYFQCLSEAKGEPDYTRSDDYQVELHLPGLVKDKAFTLFISKIQEDKSLEERLSVREIIALERVRRGEEKANIDADVLRGLIQKGHVEKIGKTRSQRLRLSRTYYEFVNKKGEYTADKPLDGAQVGILIVTHLNEFKEAKMADFVQLFGKFYSKEQVKYLIYRLADSGILEKKGKGSGTKYFLGKQVKEGQQIFARAIQLGIEQMVQTGEVQIANKDSAVSIPQIKEKK